jgi:hypothetical protein
MGQQVRKDVMELRAILGQQDLQVLLGPQEPQVVKAAMELPPILARLVPQDLQELQELQGL